MIEPARYFDVRSDFWQGVFADAADYDAYLDASDPDRARRWRDKEREIPGLDDVQRQRLTGHNRRLNVLCLSGVWCGDCVRQGPMLRNLAEACGAVLRWVDREANVELRDELRLCGAMRVPAVVFLTEDFWEIGRFGDRLLSVYRRKAENEVGAACALPHATTPEGQLAEEQAEWLDIFERMLLMARLSPPLRERHGD